MGRLLINGLLVQIPSEASLSKILNPKLSLWAPYMAASAIGVQCDKCCKELSTIDMQVYLLSL